MPLTLTLNDLEQCNDRRRSPPLRYLSFLFTFVESAEVLDFRRSHGADNTSFRSKLNGFLMRHTRYRSTKNKVYLSERLTKSLEDLLTYLRSGGEIVSLEELVKADYFREQKYVIAAFQRNQDKIIWDE